MSMTINEHAYVGLPHVIFSTQLYIQVCQSRDTQLVIAHFMEVFLSMQGMSKKGILFYVGAFYRFQKSTLVLQGIILSLTVLS